MKSSASKICFIAAIILLVCFAVKTTVDYVNYSSTLNSAPFYVWVLVNALMFILPAVIALVLGFVLQRRECR